MDLNINKTVDLLRQAVVALEEASVTPRETARRPAANDPGSSCADGEIRRLLTNTSTTSTPITRPNGTSSSEIRRLFTPYNRSNPRRVPVTQQRQSKWSHKFLCLADPQQDYVPTKDMKVNLFMAGLGEKRLVLDKSLDPAYFKESVLEHYPKLKGGGGFELLRTCNRTCLEIIPPQRSGYTTSFLADSCSLGQCVIFIRPLQQALNMDISAYESEPTDDCPIEKCLICEKDIPIIQLKSHIKEEHEGDDALPVIKSKKTKIRPICDYVCQIEDLESELQKNDTQKWTACPICFEIFREDLVASHSASCCDETTHINESHPISLHEALEKFKVDVFGEKKEKINISVLRNKFLQTAMENLDDIDFQQIINVIFIGEEGVDAGGLTREFFSLLFKQTPVFENGGFNVNSQLLSDKIYQIIGKAASYSVLNGNQGPQCLRSHLVKYILSNVLPTDEEIPEEILPANVLYVLQEMGRLDNEGLNTLLTENADVFEAAGFRQKLHSGSKQSAALALHQHFGFYRFLPAMIQFIDGLKLHGVYDLLVKYPKESSLFLSIHETTYSDIIDMYQPSYSSDQEEKNIEEIIVYNLHQFLRKLQRGKITSEWISLNDITDVNTPVKLTIKDFLQAVTGSSSISNNIKIGLILFDHKSDLLTTVNTSAPSITFSQTSSLKEYSFLEKSMINIIVGAYGFGIN